MRHGTCCFQRTEIYCGPMNNPPPRPRMKTIAFLSLAGLCRLAAAQTPAMTTLQIDMANQRAYVQDIPDPQKYASDPTAVATSGFRIFASIVNLMDIVAVNGKPAKGTFVARGTRVGLSPNSGAGTAVADVERSQSSDWSFEILQDDGTPVGTLMALGLAGGDPPPGGPMNSWRSSAEPAPSSAQGDKPDKPRSRSRDPPAASQCSP